MAMARAGATGGWLTRSMSACPPSIGCASGWSRTGSKLLSTANRWPTRSRAPSTARRKRVSWPSRGARRRRVARPGRCTSWQRSWSKWRSSTPSVWKLCGKREKKRPQALAEGAVGHSAEGQRRGRLRDGRDPGGVSAPVRLERIDYEYERNGTGNLCMMFEPLAGRREVLVTARRTAVDSAEAIRPLVDVCHPKADPIILGQDNLNTHKLASLYEAFPPEEARRLIDKLEVHYTPKHGRWLNMAEIELGVVRQQCLDRRIPDFSTLTDEVAAWQSNRNAAQVKVDWQFTTADARVKLKRLYPILEPVKIKWTDH